MAFLEKLIGGGVVTAAEGVANVIDRFVETPDERRAAEAAGRSFCGPAGYRSPFISFPSMRSAHGSGRGRC